MDLLTIAALTGLPIRRLRYALEHGLLPGAEKASRGHRVTRTFTDFEAFGIACAAALLHGGLRRPLVHRCMAELLRPSGARGPRNGLLHLLQASSGGAVLDVADGQHFRVVIGEQKKTRWQPLRADQGSSLVEPLAVLRLDAAALRDALRSLP